MSTLTPPMENLHRKIEVTTRARYNAANRLGNHQRLSQWTLAALSVELILIPLFQAMDVPLRVSAESLNAIEVFLAVLVLAYSQLLSAENYALRADKMWTCGRELGRLNRDVAPLVTDAYDPAVYANYVKQYHDILDKYENHADIDYDLYRLKRGMDGHHLLRRIWSWITIRSRYWIGFLHYSIVLLFTALSIVYMFWQG